MKTKILSYMDKFHAIIWKISKFLATQIGSFSVSDPRRILGLLEHNDLEKFCVILLALKALKIENRAPMRKIWEP